jgi:hypothetical protein
VFKQITCPNCYLKTTWKISFTHSRKSFRAYSRFLRSVYGDLDLNEIVFKSTQFRIQFYIGKLRKRKKDLRFKKNSTGFRLESRKAESEEWF